MRIGLIGLLLCSLVDPLSAQGEESRYDFFNRVRSMEMAWARADLEAKGLAAPELKQAYLGLIGQKYSQASFHADAARFALEGREPTALRRALVSHCIVVAAGLMEPGDEQRIEVKPAYSVKGAALEKRQILWRLMAPGRPEPLCEGKTSESSFDLSTEIEGDHRLEVRLLSGDEVVDLAAVGISVAREAVDRIKAFPEELFETPGLQAESLVALTLQLAELLGSRAETDLPAHRLLAESEAARKEILKGRPFWGSQRSGEHWLSYESSRGTMKLRCQVPEKDEFVGKRPLVLAFHGMSGSENTFFDAYGAGMIADLCRARGWYLVTTKYWLLGGPKLPELHEKILKLFPDADRERVFAIGHSLGAGRGIQLAERAEGSVRAVAALGGGGKSRRPWRLEEVPVFIAEGALDEGTGSEMLHESLQGEGEAARRLKIYPGVGSYSIVQEALPEIFAFFDSCLSPSDTEKR